MVIRLVGVLMLAIAMAATSSAQFFAFGPPGPIPPAGQFDPLGPSARPDRISIRSPFFRMELSPYGGNYSTPYSSFSIPIPPPPFPGVSPRGWRPPFFNDRIPLGHGTDSYLGGENQFGGLEEYSPQGPSILEPAPVPPPQYDVPSFSEVFPNESRDQQLSASVRIANQLQRSLDRLSASLATRESGDVWSDYLRLEDIEAFANQLARRNDFTPDQFDLARELAVNFDAATASADLNWLQASPGFESLRGTLNAIVNAATSGIATERGSSAEHGSSAEQVPNSLDDSSSQRSVDRSNGNGFEDLPAPTPEPINKPKRVFRAEI